MNGSAAYALSMKTSSDLNHFQFRENNGTPQYKLDTEDDSAWRSLGGSGGTSNMSIGTLSMTDHLDV